MPDNDDDDDKIDPEQIARFLAGPGALIAKRYFGRKGERFQRELSRFLEERPCWVGDGSVPIPHREGLFRPKSLFDSHDDLEVWRGLASGNGLDGDPDIDRKALRLMHVDFSEIHLNPTVSAEHLRLTGEARLAVLKQTKHIRLDGPLMEVLFFNPELIPNSWKGKPGSEPLICFDGTVIRRGDGARCVPALMWWRKREEWTNVLCPLLDECGELVLSALLIRE